MELYRASQQWWKRPDDERYLTLEDLHAATLARADRCESRVMRNDHVQVEAPEQHGDGKSLMLQVAGFDDLAAPTHWSFGQLCSRAQVDRRTARRTHPALAADLINWGLRYEADLTPRKIDESNVTVQRLPSGELELRCMVGPSYGRIYDHQVVKAWLRINADGAWHVPAGSTSTLDDPVIKGGPSQWGKIKGRSTTLYASDRDVFIFLVDERRPIEIGGEALYRGVMTWNSEVGKTTLGLSTFLYRRVCDNRIVWGAKDVRTMKIRHSSGAPERFEREMKPALREYAEASLYKTVRSLRQARSMEVGKTKDDAIEWLSKRRQFSKSLATKIVDRAIEEEGECRTLWQVVQGGTALARGITHTDTRVDAERRVSGLLKLAEAKVA